MKVIFIGMHNKPGKMPLCSSTKSGKVIDRIISQLGKVEYLKTNLYDVEYIPKLQDKWSHVQEWYQRINPNKNDIIVLLGQEVCVNFYNSSYNKIVKLAHPASIFYKSKDETDKYISNAVNLIISQK